MDIKQKSKTKIKPKQTPTPIPNQSIPGQPSTHTYISQDSFLPPKDFVSHHFLPLLREDERASRGDRFLFGAEFPLKTTSLLFLRLESLWRLRLTRYLGLRILGKDWLAKKEGLWVKGLDPIRQRMHYSVQCAVNCNDDLLLNIFFLLGEASITQRQMMCIVINWG